MTRRLIGSDLDLGAIREKRHRPAQLAPAWSALLIQSANVLSRYELWGIKQIIYYLNAASIDPADVTDKAFDAFATAKQASFNRFKGRLRIRAALRGWNRLRLEVPTLRLAAPPQLLEPRFNNPPFSLYPISFQEDLAAFCREASIGGTPIHPPFSGRGYGSKPPARTWSAPLTAHSLRTHLQLIRSAAGAQVRAGRTIESITSISQIVTANALTILLAEMRARQRLRAQSGSVQPRQHYIEAQVVATVVGIVRRWCRSASEEKAIAHIRRNLRWRGSYDRLFRPARVTTAMRQFEDADAVRRWFELADQHVTAAETARLGGRKLTQRLVNDVEFAVMSQLLRDSPIRIRTLAALRIAGDHPNITQGGSPFLVIYAADNKNFKPIKAPLSSDTKKVLTLYLAHYRYHYVQDSAGPGRFRGGLGVGMTIEALLPDTIVAMRGMGRTGFAPWGVHGGHPGALTKPAVLNAGRPDERIIPKLDILGMKRGETLTLASSGGGGYGDPLDRDIQSVRDDVIYGFVSRVQAADTYGVVFNGSTDAVDADRTRVRRETLKDQRPVTRTIYAYGAGRERHDRVWSLEGRSAILSILNGLPIPSRSNAKILIMQKALDLFAERSLESIGRREIDEAWLATRAKLGLEV